MLTNKTFSKESNFRNNAVTKIVMSQKLRTKILGLIMLNYFKDL